MLEYKFTQFLVIFSTIYSVLCQSTEFHKNIQFNFYDKNGNISLITNSPLPDILSNTQCKPTEPVAIIVHGYGENCEIDWAINLIKNFNKYRGGCVICMNYGYYAEHDDYFTLVQNHKPISTVLSDTLLQLKQQNFQLGQTYIFGFSFGGPVSLQAGRNIGTKVLQQIDVCDHAGVLFDLDKTYQEFDPMESAQRVQCIHTSTLVGTSFRNCHENWIMGKCGRSQAAGGALGFGSHSLCPVFYNSAFTNPFYNEKSSCGNDTRLVQPLSTNNYFVGYNDGTHDSYPIGNYYAKTYKHPPYNKKIVKVGKKSHF